MSAAPRAYAASAAVCAALVAIPFLAVTIPPITDLPQQTAQIRLLGEALGDGESPYRVQWLHPNKLGYAPLALAWGLSDPLAAGRLGLLAIGLLWVGALHLLAAAAGRPPASAALASLFFFNHLTYWGILNFLVGLPLFALWLVLLERLPAALGWRDGAKLLLLAALLYQAHVLWLAGGVVWLVLAALAGRLPWGALVRRLAWVGPILLVAALWYPRLAESGFISETRWGRSPLGRLHPEWILNSAFGGIEGWAEPVVALAVLAWLVLGWLRRDRGSAAHRGLLLAGLFFVGVALCLPGVQQSTVFFASRWLPVGVVLLTLASPPPRLVPWLRAAVPYVLLASLVVATAAVWIDFENEELDGLHEALAALPALAPEERVLGLDFGHTSERLKGFPFYHLYAYAQVLRGGGLYHTFADFASSLVVYRDLPRQLPWTEGLDWQATKVRQSDMDHFRYAIVYGPESVHAVFLQDERLTPLTGGKPWRLYRVEASPSPSSTF